MNNQPSVRWIEVLIRSEVLYQERGTQRALEDSSVEECSFGDSDLSKNASDIGGVDDGVAASEAKAGRHSQTDDAVACHRGVAEGRPADQTQVGF